MTHSHKFTVHVLPLQQLKYWLKYSDFNALLKASLLLSSRTGKGSRFQKSGAVAWKRVTNSGHSAATVTLD